MPRRWILNENNINIIKYWINYWRKQHLTEVPEGPIEPTSDGTCWTKNNSQTDVKEPIVGQLQR